MLPLIFGIIKPPLAKVASFDESRSYFVGLDWKHGISLSRYILFIAKMLNNVPSSFIVERSIVLFFRTMLKSPSESALLCGITRTNSASFGSNLKRFTSFPAIRSFEICHQKISTL